MSRKSPGAGQPPCEGEGGPAHRPWRSWLAPGLLIAVAITQMFFATERGLDAWRGGGFGMFATNDRPAARAVLCEGLDTTGRPVVMPEARLESLMNADLLTRFRTFPNRADATRIARLVRGVSQPRWLRINLSVWRLRFEPGRRLFRWERVGPEFSVPAQE